MSSDDDGPELRLQEIRDVARALLALLEDPELRRDRRRFRAAARGLTRSIEQLLAGESPPDEPGDEPAPGDEA